MEHARKNFYTTFENFIPELREKNMHAAWTTTGAVLVECFMYRLSFY